MRAKDRPAASVRRNPDIADDLIGTGLQVGIPLALGIVGWKVLENKWPAIFGRHYDPATGQPTGTSAGGTAPASTTAAGTPNQPPCQGPQWQSLPHANDDRQMAVEWRAARWAAYQDPDDWNAFRAHVAALTGGSNKDAGACPWQGWPDLFGGSFAPLPGQVGRGHV